MKPVIVASVSERIKEAMEKKQISQAEICKRTGIDKGSMSSYVSGRYEPKSDRIILIAEALNVSSSWLSGFNVPMAVLKSPLLTVDFVVLPVIGEIAAGYEHIAIEDWEGDTIAIPDIYVKGHPDNYIVLRIIGDSMYPFYLEGDKVLIRRQDAVESGDVAAVLYENEYATLKKIEYTKESMKLIPFNPEYQVREIEGEEINRCRIIGIPKLLIRDIR